MKSRVTAQVDRLVFRTSWNPPGTTESVLMLCVSGGCSSSNVEMMKQVKQNMLSAAAPGIKQLAWGLLVFRFHCQPRRLSREKAEMVDDVRETNSRSFTLWVTQSDRYRSWQKCLRVSSNDLQVYLWCISKFWCCRRLGPFLIWVSRSGSSCQLLDPSSLHLKKSVVANRCHYFGAKLKRRPERVRDPASLTGWQPNLTPWLVKAVCRCVFLFVWVGGGC